MPFLRVDFHSDVLGMAMEMDVILPQSAQTQIGMASSGGGAAKRFICFTGYRTTTQYGRGERRSSGMSPARTSPL